MGPIGTYWTVPANLPRERWTGGELLALRAWRLARWSEDGGVRLQSLSRDVVWHGPVFAADRAPQPATTCGSGVYAIKASRRPHGWGIPSYAAPAHDWLTGAGTWVWGWVALFGQVVEHVEGYRSQGVVVRRLHLGVLAHLAFPDPEALARLIRELEDRYQCPVKGGYWEARKAFRMRSLASRGNSRAPVLDVVRPVVPPPAPLVPAIRGPAPSPAPAFRRRRRPANRRKGPAPTPDAVVKAFRKAERMVGSDWKLSGRGHCRRVTIRMPDLRHVAPATTCWKEFSPHDAMGRRIVFPMAVVEVAAKLLGVPLGDLMLREY